MGSHSKQLEAIDRMTNAKANFRLVLKLDPRMRLIQARANLFAAHESFNKSIQQNLTRIELAATHESWDEVIREFTEALTQHAIAVTDRKRVQGEDLPDEHRRAA